MKKVVDLEKLAALLGLKLSALQILISSSDVVTEHKQ
jgi:hypothetical protein